MNHVMLSMSFGDRVAYAGRMTLIGMLTIFLALSILWGALALFRVVLAAAQKRKAAKADPAPKGQEPTLAPAPVLSDHSHNEQEIVAAITAAISAMLAEENGGTVQGFRVVSFRRTRGNAK